MKVNIAQEIAALARLTVTQLRSKHIEVFGEETRAGNKEYLVKRIAWRIQANAWGDLSSRARRRAKELANDADLRTTPPRATHGAVNTALTTTATVSFNHDARLPMPGAILRRRYKDREVAVRVLPRGFEWEGEVYRTLSALAGAITNTHINGYDFFNLRKKGTADG